MNITGAPLYSNELTAIRRPGMMENNSTLNKLIFVYPFGIDTSVMNIPFSTAVKGDMDTVGDSLRAFFSISILKEIFTSNALNMVTMASTYSETQKTKPKSDVLIKSLLRGNDGTPYNNWSNYADRDLTAEKNPMDAAQLQSKINQKFDEIKKLLRIDNRMRKLLPFMEVITLQNFFDVPVITGTYQFQLDSGALFTLLAGAIATRTPLTEWGRVKTIFNRLHQMQDDNIYQIFDVLSNIEMSNNSGPTVSSMDLPGGVASEYESIRNQMAQTTNPQKQMALKSRLDGIKDQYARLYIGNLKDTKLLELERNFKFMLDPQQLLIREGLGHANAQASMVMKKISPQTELMFGRIQEQTMEIFGGLNSFFSSIYMIFSPIIATDPQWGKNFIGMRQDMVNEFTDSFPIFLSGPKGIKQLVSTKLSEGVDKSRLIVDRINKSCESSKEDFVSTMNYINRAMSGKQVLPSFSIEDVQRFSNSVDEILGKLEPIQRSVKNSLLDFFDSDEVAKIENDFDTLLTGVLDNYFQSFGVTRDPTTKLQARLFAILPDTTTSTPEENNERKMRTHSQLLAGAVNAAQQMFKTLFLLIFKLNLCEFVEVADVEFTTASTDVLELPNYCLVLPVEIMQALNVLYTKRNWKDAVISSGSGGFNPINFSYLKGVVRFLKNHLCIPNLIVYDKKKKEIYYSFKYMGNSTEKLKMQSVETYVKHHLQEKESGVSQVFY